MQAEQYNSGALVPGKGDGDLIALSAVAAGAAALGALAVGALAINHAMRHKPKGRTIVIGDPVVHTVRMRIVVTEEVVKLVTGA